MTLGMVRRFALVKLLDREKGGAGLPELHSSPSKRKWRRLRGFITFSSEKTYPHPAPGAGVHIPEVTHAQ